MDFKNDSVTLLLEATMRCLLRDLNDESDPQDKERLAGAVAHLQRAIRDGLSQSNDEGAAALSRLVDEALNLNQKPAN